MITDFFFHGVFLILQFLLGGLTSYPDATIDPRIPAAFATMGTYIHSFVVFMPLFIAAILAGIVLLLAVEVALFFFKIAIFGIKKIPFIG